VPEGKGEAVVIARLLIRMLNDEEVADAPAESVTLMVKVNVPCAVGVPEINTELVELDPSESPLGTVPEAIDHV